MKTLVATITCHRDQNNGRNDGIRDTWLKKWGYLIDHVWVYGRGDIPYKDPQNLECMCSDDYDAIPYKVHTLCCYAIVKEYEDLFVSDVDTHIVVPLLLNSRLGDYAGWRCDEGHAAGGNGYWLSANAMYALFHCAPYAGYQDKWVGENLARSGVALKHDPRFIGGVPPRYVPGTISAHLGRATGTFDPQWMRDYHNTYLEQTPCG